MAATTPPDRDDETGAEFDGLPETDGTDAETICGEPTDDGSPCERETESGEPCFMHGEDGPPADHGAPEGNHNGDDNAGGGAPEENTNAFKHGFHTATKRRMGMFDDDQLALFGDYYAEFIQKAENESAAARLASLAVIADELETEFIQNGVFSDVLDVGDGSSEERTTGQTPKDETLNALLRVLRELRLGKESEGVTGNDLGAEARAKQHFSYQMSQAFADDDELSWREGEQGLPLIDPEAFDQQRERPPSPPGPDSLPDDLPDDVF